MEENKRMEEVTGEEEVYNIWKVAQARRSPCGTPGKAASLLIQGIGWKGKRWGRMEGKGGLERERKRDGTGRVRKGWVGTVG